LLHPGNERGKAAHHADMVPAGKSDQVEGVLLGGINGTVQHRIGAGKPERALQGGFSGCKQPYYLRGLFPRKSGPLNGPAILKTLGEHGCDPHATPVIDNGGIAEAYPDFPYSPLNRPFTGTGGDSLCNQT